jgi:hypothetical protein
MTVKRERLRQSCDGRRPEAQGRRGGELPPRRQQYTTESRQGRREDGTGSAAAVGCCWVLRSSR